MNEDLRLLLPAGGARRPGAATDQRWPDRLSTERRGRQSSGPPVARAGFGDIARKVIGLLSLWVIAAVAACLVLMG
jgi:hypothetical protein